MNRKSILLKDFNREGFSRQQITRLTFACSKSTIETLEKGVKYVVS